MTELAPPRLAPACEAALARAVATLEAPHFATRLADYAGQPINRALGLLPDLTHRRVTAAVELAVRRCLAIAIDTLEETTPRRPRTRLSSAMAGVTGGVGGFLGVGALAVELPLTTTLMLRAIADIARHEGEDLTRVETRLACLQVFALGSRRTNGRADVGYYAARALLSRITNDAAAMLIERGAAGLSAPAVNGLVAEIVSRFSMVVADKVAVGAVPVLGAIGGASVNVIFMDHYQRVARGHFTIRRLERRYGAEAVRSLYVALVDQGRPARVRTPPKH